MFNLKTQQAKAKIFRDLHHNGKLLVLPNIWEPLGAALIENLGFPAIATASASIAFTNGYDDGENISFNDLIKLLEKITAAVDIPVTADIESGYANTETELSKNIERLIQSGIVGINIEDYNKKEDTFFDVERQCERIRLIRNISADNGVPLFINARTDVYSKAQHLTDKEKFEEAVKRGRAYMQAGSDCFFPLAIKNREDIQQLITELHCPVNIIAVPGLPDLQTLQDLGVARVSLGPSLLKIAIRAMKEMALKLKNYQGLEEITGNEITTDYLKSLINKN